MNARRARTFALYYLVNVVGFGYREAVMSIDAGGFEPYQLDELAWAGVYRARMSEEQVEKGLQQPHEESAHEPA